MWCSFKEVSIYYWDIYYQDLHALLSCELDVFLAVMFPRVFCFFWFLCLCLLAGLLSCVWLFATSWTILQARILEWIAIPFSRGSSRSRDQTQVSCIAGRFIIIWATREAHSLIHTMFKWMKWLRGGPVRIQICTI